MFRIIFRENRVSSLSAARIVPANVRNSRGYLVGRTRQESHSIHAQTAVLHNIVPEHINIRGNYDVP